MTGTLMSVNHQITMTSREIADLVGSRHDKVKQSIERLVAQGVIESPPLVGYKSITGQSGQEYIFTGEKGVSDFFTTLAQLRPAVGGILGSQIKDVSAIIKALNDFEIPDDLPDMFVYAIREVDTGNIKLGISKNPEQRLKQLQTANSSELELIAIRPAPNRYRDEAKNHQLNIANHIRGEWFSACATLN